MFKSIQIFRIVPDWNSDAAIIEAALDGKRFVECGASEERSIGWVEPRGEKHGPMIEAIDNQWLLKIMVESKILPSSVVKEAVQEKVEQILANTGRKPSKKETKELSEEIRRELLAKAFTKKSSGFVWIDSKAKFLIIEAGSKSKSDEIVTLLSKTLDGFGVTLLNTARSPSASMSAWLTTQEAPAGFSSDRDCMLKAADETRSTVKYAKHALDIEEIRAHIAQGKIPTQLAMTWNNRVSFILTDVLMLKKIEFQGIVFESAGDEIGFDADAAIATGELSRLIPDLINALGGEEVLGDLVVSASATSAVGDVEFDDNEMYRQAVIVVLEHKRASISLVQRHLRIGYNRAARLLEMMESNRVVSAMQGNGERTLLAASEIAEASA